MSRPLKFRNAHVNAKGNVKFSRPAQKQIEQPTGTGSVKSPDQSKPVPAGMQNQTFTNIAPAGGTATAAGSVQFLTSQGTPVISGSSILVPPVGTVPVVQNSGTPIQIIQRTTILHGTGKSLPSAGQTYPIVSCVGSTVPTANAVQLVQDQTGKFQIIQNQPSPNIQILQNQPQTTVQVLQNQPRSSIQIVQNQSQVCMKTQPKTLNQPQANLQVICNQNTGVQLLSNQNPLIQSTVPVNVKMDQQPAVKVVQARPGGLQYVSSGSLPVITLPNNLNFLSQQSSDAKLIDGKLVHSIPSEMKGDISNKMEVDDKPLVTKTGNVSETDVSPVLRHLLKPKFGTSALSTNLDISPKQLKVVRKKNNSQKKIGKIQRTAASPKLVELLPKVRPSSQQSDLPRDETVSEDAAANNEGLCVTHQSGDMKATETVSEGQKKPDEKSEAEKDGDLVVIINKEQQKESNEDTQLSFAGTSVKPKFAIEFSPNNLQAYVQAVANAVENHKALSGQSKSDTKHKKKKNKHKSRDLEAEVFFEPVREAVSVSKISRRKQKLCVRNDPSDNGIVVTEIPKPVSRKKQQQQEITQSDIVTNSHNLMPEPAAKRNTTSQRKNKTLSGGSIVSMKETDEDVCVDVVGESDGTAAAREVCVFIPPSLSKSFEAAPSPQSQRVVPVSAATQTNSRESKVSDGRTTSSVKLKEREKFPVPVDKIKVEPKEDDAPKLLKQKCPVIKSLLRHDTWTEVPSSSVHNKTNTTDCVSGVTQSVEKTSKDVLPIPVQCIKEEPFETVSDVPVQKIKSSRKCLPFNSSEFGNLTTIAKMASPLTVQTGKKTKCTSQQLMEEKSLRTKLKEKITESKPTSHHHTPVKEVTALQKMITAITQETQTSKSVETQTKRNDPQVNQLMSQSRNQTNVCQPGVSFLQPASNYPPVVKGMQVVNTATAPKPPLVVNSGEPPPKVKSLTLPTQITPPSPSSITLSPATNTTNIAKLLGPFTFTQSPAPVANLPLTGKDSQQKQVFIVPNSVYSALLSAQASTGNKVQLTKSQLFSGTVIPSTIPPHSVVIPTPSSQIKIPTDPSETTVLNSVIQSSSVQHTLGPCITGVKSTSLGTSSQGKDKTILTSGSVGSIEEVSKEAGDESDRICMELKIDSVFSLNKVSCKLLDKVPSYLDMCLNSEHEHSLKLCFVVLDTKLPPMFRGKSGTKRTRLVVPKVCPLGCRADALDSMCLKNKWHKVRLTKSNSDDSSEPVIKRAKKAKKLSKSYKTI